MNEPSFPKDWKHPVQEVTSARELLELLEEVPGLEGPLPQGVGTRRERHHTIVSRAIARWARFFDDAGLLEQVSRYSPETLMANPHLQPPQAQWVLKFLGQRADQQKGKAFRTLLVSAMVAARRHTLPLSESMVAKMSRPLPIYGQTRQPPEKGKEQEERDLRLVLNQIRNGLLADLEASEVCRRINQAHIKRQTERASNDQFPLSDEAGQYVITHPMARNEDIQRVLIEAPSWSSGREVAQLASQGRTELLADPRVRGKLLTMGRNNLFYILPILRRLQPDDFPEAWKLYDQQTMADWTQVVLDCDLEAEAIGQLGWGAIEKMLHSSHQQVRKRALRASRHLENRGERIR